MVGRKVDFGQGPECSSLEAASRRVRGAVAWAGTFRGSSRKESPGGGGGGRRGSWEMRMKGLWAWPCADTNQALLFRRNGVSWDPLGIFLHGL